MKCGTLAPGTRLTLCEKSPEINKSINGGGVEAMLRIG